jgi:hypothetical protein
MRIFIKIIFPLYFFIPSILSADNDTTKNRDVPNPFTKDFDQHQFEYIDSAISIESSLNNFQNYLDKNILGNNGLPFFPLDYKLFSPSTGFNYYQNHYSNYFYIPQKLRFYNTRTPYTDLLYVAGTKREQMFKMTFSYNVKKNWNVTANFMRIRSEGVYLRQNTNDNSLALSTNYKSDNNRYWLIASLIYNDYRNAENGGISSDSVFRDGGAVDEKLLDINLIAAKKTVANANIFLKQILNFGKQQPDTSRRIIPHSRIILTSLLDANYIKYEDNNPASGYYSSIYFDSIKTVDSTFHFLIDNEFAWKRLDNLKHSGLGDMLGVGVSLKHQYIEVNQRNTDTSFNNIIIGSEFYNTYSRNLFWWNVSGKYAISGYNKENYNVSASFRKNFKDSLNALGLKIESRLQSPDLIYNFYRSNHFLWMNNFSQTQVNSAELFYEMKKHKLFVFAGHSVYSNILYFDNYAIAREFKGNVSVFKASIKKDFSLLNWHLNNKITYQKVTDSSVIRLPELVLEHSLYYENDLLKKALVLQIGASVFYTSAYYANAYMPATGQFYLQNEKKYGAYPFIDFFVNAQVKTVRVFFKIDHLNAGWNGNTYMLTPGYPYPDRTFKFGVSWKFYD